MKGGIPNTRLNTFLLRSMRGSNRYEEPSVTAQRHPLMNAYWEDKIADMSRIEIPMYLVGSYGLEIAAAELDGFHRVASRDKWLRASPRRGCGTISTRRRTWRITGAFWIAI